LRQFIGEAVSKGKTLSEIKENIDFPWYQDWTGVPVRQQGENIEHVFKELGGRTK